jgi:hypothetical protein
MRMMESGYGCWFFPPQAVRQFTCTVCGSVCEVFRNVDGPTSWAEAMARRHHVHDRSVCPRVDEPCHQDAIGFLKWIQGLPETEGGRSRPR